jgi:hypothetical protein
MGKLRIGVITNPNSKKNRARRGRAAELQRILGDRGVVRETRSVEEIQPVIREFLAQDVRYWVSDGGDGALHWLINEAQPEFAARGMGLPLTVPTNGGTIDFVAKKVGIRGQADQILARLVEAETTGAGLPVEEVPSFVLSGTRIDASGVERPFERIGFTAAVCGVGQRFFDLYYLEPLPGPDTLVKIIAKGVGSIYLNAPVIRSLPIVPRKWREYVHYLLKPHEVRVLVDGVPLPDPAQRALHVGSLFVDIGGVVRLFPFAGNGKLHVMSGNPTMPQVLFNLPKLMLGRPMTSQGVDERPCLSVEVEATGEELLAPCVDGEIFRDVKRLKLVPGPRVRIPKIDCGRDGLWPF